MDNIEILIENLKEETKKLKKENLKLRRVAITNKKDIEKEIYKEVIAKIRKIKIPISNSAVAFSFELEKMLEQIEKKYNI